MHVWSSSGEHIGFYSKEEYQANCQKLMNNVPADSTAWRQLSKEKKRYESGKGMRRSPNLHLITSNYQDLLKNYQQMQEEPKDAANFVVKPAWYSTVKPIIKDLEDIKGFSPCLVQPLVADAIRVLFREEGLISEAEIFQWEPSIQWLRWFMRMYIEYRFRRVESPRIDEATLMNLAATYPKNLAAKIAKE